MSICGQPVRVKVMATDFVKNKIIKSYRFGPSQAFSIIGDIDTISFYDPRVPGESDEMFFEGVKKELQKEKYTRICNGENKEADVLYVATNICFGPNFYGKRIGNNIRVISIYNMEKVLKDNKIEPVKFIEKSIFNTAITYKALGGTLSSTADGPMGHDETRGCLFDMTARDDIVHMFENTIICDQCKSLLVDKEKFPETTLTKECIDAVEVELRDKIQKSVVVKLPAILKNHPIVSAVTTASAMVVSIEKARNVLFAFFKWLFS